jgi:hypothetical protein
MPRAVRDGARPLPQRARGSIRRRGHRLDVLDPGHDRSWLQRLGMCPRAGGGGRSKRGRLRSARAGVQANGASGGQRADPTAAGGPYHDGPAIALLAAWPLWLRNLAALELGLHLVREGEAGGLSISGAATKIG